MFSSPPVFLYSSYITLLSGFTDTIHFPLFISLMFLLLISLHLVASPSPPPSFLPLPQRRTHLCDRLLLTHSTSAALQMRVERERGGRGGGCHAGPGVQGLMKPP